MVHAEGMDGGGSAGVGGTRWGQWWGMGGRVAAHGRDGCGGRMAGGGGYGLGGRAATMDTGAAAPTHPPAAPVPPPTS